MNTNRNKMGGVGIYLVVIAVIAVLYFALARLSHHRHHHTATAISCGMSRTDMYPAC